MSLSTRILLVIVKIANGKISNLAVSYPRSGPCSLEWGYGGPLVTLSGLLMVFYLKKKLQVGIYQHAQR
jgi:hypothetical protein